MGRCQISSGNGRYANLFTGSFEFYTNYSDNEGM